MAMNTDVQLSRKDLFQVTCVTGRGLGLIPPSDKKKMMKVVVGADNGILTCFRMKKGEAIEEFKTNNLDYPVSKLYIGGPVDKRDRVFFTSAQTIRGVNKKGKEFFRFNTEGAETLKGLQVEENKIWTSGEYMYAYYVDTKDAGYFMSKDRINDLMTVPLLNQVDVSPVLGCQDRYIRVLEANKLHFEAFVEGAVLSISKYESRTYDDVLKGNKDKEVLFGSDNGLVGQVLMNPKTIKPGWTMQNTKGLGGVVTIKTQDLTRNGTDDIVLGRDDGEIQVLSLQSNGEPEEVFTKSVNESVQDLDIGKVCTATFDEVVVTTYSGKIISFTTEPSSDAAAQAFVSAPRMVEKTLTEGPSESSTVDSTVGSEETKTKKKSGLSSFFGLGKKKDKDDKKDGPKMIEGLVLDRDSGPKTEGDEELRSDPKEREKKVSALKAELEQLKAKVQESKLSFQSISKENVPVSTRSKVKSSLLLDPDQACYKLTLESETPIDIVALQSSMPLLILDPGTSVPSTSEPDPENGNLFLATLRVQGTSSRVQVQILVTEGQYGALNAFVVTRVAPKVVHLVENKVMPLSLHRSLPMDAPSDTTISMSEIKMQGSFSLGQMHAWVGACFPSVPTKPPQDDIVKYQFESCFSKTRVQAEYCKGEATFRSTNLSVLAVIKDVISKEAAKISAKLDVRAPVINESCVLYVLQQLHPRLEKLLKLKESVKYIEALNELNNQAEDMSYLSAELMDVLKNQDDLTAEHAKNSKKIEFIESVLEQYFIDRFKFKGVNVKHRIGEIRTLVAKYSWEALLNIFAVS